MTTYLSTKETAKLIRQTLKATFPQTRFSVRQGRGTGSAWISIGWTDGPVLSVVDELVSRYQGRTFNGMTDGYDECGTQLVAFAGDELPQEVRYSCDGTSTTRDYTRAAYQLAEQLIQQTNPDLQVLDETGEPMSRHQPHDVITVGETRYYDLINMAELVRRVCAGTDLTPLSQICDECQAQAGELCRPCCTAAIQALSQP